MINNPKKIRVLQSSDWSFEPMDKFIAAGGEAFSVSRFGYELLIKQKDIEIKVVSPNRSKKLAIFIFKLLGNEGLNLWVQIKLIKESHKCDLIYYAADRHPYLIALARILGICKAPILMLCHFSYDTSAVDNRLKKYILALERLLVFRGVDKIVFNCETVMTLAANNFKVPERHLNNSGWGADISYFSKRDQLDFKTPETFYFAAGGANRDYKTLFAAFRRMPYNLVVSCPKYVIDRESPLPKNIIHWDYSSQGMQAYSTLRSLYQKSKAVLIPILYCNHVANGASVFVEALACGKPILISDQKTNYLNVELERVGKKVKMHSADDWVEKIRILEDDPKETSAMGERAYLIAKNRYNYKLFSDNIASCFRSVLSEN